jgi:hypothetical protein
MSKQVKKVSPFVAIVVAAVALSSGQTKATTVDFNLGVQDQPVAWPSFTDSLDDQPAHTTQQLVITHDGVSLLTTPTVSAPLPPSVVTGACMLVGNFVLTQMWKKRPI